MFCMRCGKELKDSHTFCPDCRESMKDYPIPAGTPVQLLQRTPAAGQKKKAGPRRERKPEEQIQRLRAAVRWLTLALVAAILAFAFTAMILLHQQEEPESPETPRGQNYSTLTERS